MIRTLSAASSFGVDIENLPTQNHREDQVHRQSAVDGDGDGAPHVSVGAGGALELVELQVSTMDDAPPIEADLDELALPAFRRSQTELNAFTPVVEDSTGLLSKLKTVHTKTSSAPASPPTSAVRIPGNVLGDAFKLLASMRNAGEKDRKRMFPLLGDALVGQLQRAVGVYDTAQISIMELMRRDSYPRYLRSPQHEEVRLELERSATLAGDVDVFRLDSKPAAVGTASDA